MPIKDETAGFKNFLLKGCNFKSKNISANRITFINISEIPVANAAPTIPNSGINIKLPPIFNKDPKRVFKG